MCVDTVTANPGCNWCCCSSVHCTHALSTDVIPSDNASGNILYCVCIYYAEVTESSPMLDRNDCVHCSHSSINYCIAIHAPLTCINQLKAVVSYYLCHCLCDLNYLTTTGEG